LGCGARGFARAAGIQNAELELGDRRKNLMVCWLSAHASWGSRWFPKYPRRRNGRYSGWAFSVAENAQDCSSIGTGRGRCDERRPAIRVQGLTGGLVGWPRRSAWRRHIETHPFKLRRRSQVGNPRKGDLPFPKGTRHHLVGAKTVFREPAIPFRPGSAHSIGEIKGLDDFAALPATICRMGGSIEDLSAVWNLPPPDSGDGRRVDVNRHTSLQEGTRRRRRLATPLGSGLPQWRRWACCGSSRGLACEAK
jgi:hypothetical protein